MELKSGYKQTELGVIPKDWDVSQLTILISSLEAGVSVNSVDKEKDIYAHDASVLKTSCVFGGKFLPEENKKILPSDIHRSKTNPRKDSIIISRMNTPLLVGECGYIDRDYQNLFLPDRLWMTKHNVQKPPCVRWLAYVLAFPSFNRAIKESATGTSNSMKNISKGALLAVQIPHPPKAEQEAIADALSDADALIESLEQLIVKKRHIKQGAMQELLTSKRRLPGFSEGWKTKPLGDVAPLQRGFDLPTSKLIQGPYPVVYSNGILNQHVTFQVKAPGVVTGRSGTIGTVTFVEQDFWPHNTALWVTSFKGNDPKFIFYLYRQVGLERFATGSGVPTLNRNDVHEFKVKIPPSIVEQTAIAEILSDMDAEIAALEAKLAKARQIKQGMMQELLTGRIRLL
jgi:type I restriction enzyme S subunit